MSTYAHDDLGLHCLDGAHPPFAFPTLADITGPFALRIKLRVLQPIVGATILSFTNNKAESMRLSLSTPTEGASFLVWEWLRQDNNRVVATTPFHTSMLGKVQEWNMGLQPDGAWWIGSNTTTSTTNPLSPSSPLTLENLGQAPFVGALLGLQLWPVEHQQQRAPRGLRDLEHWNLPGQIHGGFVAHFYARFDDLRTRRAQHILDMGTDEQNFQNIVVAQGGSDSTARDLLLSYHDVMEENDRHVCGARNVLVQGEMAFWHVGAEPNGTMWIQKNDMIVAQCHEKPLPQRVFRRNMRFGESSGTSDPLDGVVLGFRVDLHKHS